MGEMCSAASFSSFSSFSETEAGRPIVLPAGYYTTLTNADMDKGFVIDLCVGRVGYGEVSLPGVTFLDALGDHSLDKIFRFEEGRLLTFDQASSHVPRPCEGEGLNRPSIVTLQQVHPTVGETPAGYEDRLRGCTEELGGKFVSWDGERGVWKFTLPHF